MKKDVSIIIVNYNTKKLLKDCLTSIFEHTKDIRYEVIVSDNGSADGSVEMIQNDFPDVRIIENNANIGFGAANNNALAIAHGKYIFYLNSDTVLLNNAIKFFFDYWERSTIQNLGALGANLLDENNNIIHSGGHFKTIDDEIKDTIHDLLRSYKNSIPLFQKIHLGNLSSASPVRAIGKIDYVTGADLFVKNDVFAKFDERYFLYYEDTDLQKTMELANKCRMLIDGPLIKHIKGQSNKTYTVMSFYGSRSKIETFLSMCLYQKKFHFHPFRLCILKILIFFIWINPCLFKKTRIYIPRLFKI